MIDAWRSIGEVADEIVEDIIAGLPPKPGRPQVHDSVKKPDGLPELLDEAA